MARAFHEIPLPLFDPDEVAAARAAAGAAAVLYQGSPPPAADPVHGGGAAAMPDYELLELVLFRAIPRQDVKPLARRLLDRFGDFNRVLAAPARRLAEVQGVGDAVVQELKIVEAAAQRMARARVMHRPVLSGWDALLDYCHTSMAHREIEQFRVLYLDRKNVLIADEEQARGTVDHVPVYPREVVKRALELNASALILVHNHPSGDPTPSEADIAMTVQVAGCRRGAGADAARPPDHRQVARIELPRRGIPVTGRGGPLSCRRRGCQGSGRSARHSRPACRSRASRPRGRSPRDRRCAGCPRSGPACRGRRSLA